MPNDIPKVQEIGATSAPLMSASFFIGDRCRAYNDDYMKCKAEANGRGELDCLKEGRKVTRCAASVYVLRTAMEMVDGIDVEQDQGYQHPLLEAVQRSLAMPRKQQPPHVRMPETGGGLESMCI